MNEDHQEPSLSNQEPQDVIVELMALKNMAEQQATGIGAVIDRLNLMAKALEAHDGHLATDEAETDNHAARASEAIRNSHSELLRQVETERASKLGSTTGARTMLNNIIFDLKGLRES